MSEFQLPLTSIFCEEEREQEREHAGDKNRDSLRKRRFVENILFFSADVNNAPILQQQAGYQLRRAASRVVTMLQRVGSLQTLLLYSAVRLCCVSSTLLQLHSCCCVSAVKCSMMKEAVKTCLKEQSVDLERK